MMMMIDSLKPASIPDSLKNTDDVVMTVTDVFNSAYRGDLVAVRILRGYINTNAMKPMMILPSRQPCSISCM